jgi:ketosteroid isomerase-like protein
MYHAIVKRIARRIFERVNEKDSEALLKDCALNVYHRFSGQHALGGERRGREAFGRWFARLGRLCPNLRLTVHDVWVKGWPHNTVVIIRWSGTDTLPDGSPYHNKTRGEVAEASSPGEEPAAFGVRCASPGAWTAWSIVGRTKGRA